MMRSGQGINKVVEKENNLKRVKEYILKNPDCTPGQVKKALNLSYSTIQRHSKELGLYEDGRSK